MRDAPTGIMATLQIPPHLRERLSRLVSKHGSALAAAEALQVERRELTDFLRASRVRETTVVFFETRLQAYEALPDDFARKQELAALACDILTSSSSTVADIVRRDGKNLQRAGALERLAALFRFVEGIPAPDGRVLLAHGADAPGGSTVWRVERPPASKPDEADAAPVYRALEGLDGIRG
jgi:hypothetical protein